MYKSPKIILDLDVMKSCGSLYDSLIDNYRIDYNDAIIDFQKTVLLGRAALNYTMPGQNFIQNLRYYQLSRQDLRRDFVVDDKKTLEETPFFDVAVFNLSHYKENFDLGGDDDDFVIALLNDLRETYPDIRCSVGVHAYRNPSVKQSFNQDLLVCYPGEIRENDYDVSYDRNTNKAKSQFFAFLWHKKMITEQQLYDNGVMLGKYHREILEEKKMLEACDEKKFHINAIQGNLAPVIHLSPSLDFTLPHLTIKKPTA